MNILGNFWYEEKWIPTNSHYDLKYLLDKYGKTGNTYLNIIILTFIFLPKKMKNRLKGGGCLKIG